MKTFIVALLTWIGGLVLAQIFIGGLAIALFSSNPAVYHPIFFTALVLPGLLCGWFAFRGRSKPRGPIDAIGNTLGTGGYLTVGLLMIFLYTLAILAKARDVP